MDSAARPPHPGPLRGTGACHSATLSGESAPASLSWNIPSQVRAGVTGRAALGHSSSGSWWCWPVQSVQSCLADLRYSWLLPCSHPFFLFENVFSAERVSPQHFSGQRTGAALPAEERLLPTQSRLWPDPWSSDLAGQLLGAPSRV